MKEIIAYIGAKNNLTVNVKVDGDFRVLPISYDHPKIEEIKEALKNKDADTLYDLIDKTHQITSYSNGELTIEGNAIIWKGQPISSTLVNRILHLREEGSDYEYLAAFLARLMTNPSSRAVSELYGFLEHKDLPITTDGHFLAYKAVRSDFTDRHTGEIDNSIGAEIPRMERNMVCDDKEVDCSHGYHAGTMEYVEWYSQAGNRTVIVKVDPVDVVSIPLDHNCQKLRCCWYQVVGEYVGPLTKSVYGSRGEEIKTPNPDETNGEDLDEEDDSEDTDENVCCEVVDFIDDNVDSFGITMDILKTEFPNLSIEEIEECIENSDVYSVTNGVVHYL